LSLFGKAIIISGDTGINRQEGNFKQQTFAASTSIFNPGNVPFESGAGIGKGVNVELRRELPPKKLLHFLFYLTMLYIQLLNVRKVLKSSAHRE